MVKLIFKKNKVKSEKIKNLLLALQQKCDVLVKKKIDLSKHFTKLEKNDNILLNISAGLTIQVLNELSLINPKNIKIFYEDDVEISYSELEYRLLNK